MLGVVGKVGGRRAVRPFPPRTQEADMPELTRRYLVMTMATDGPFDMKDPEAPFVLKPWKDPAALRALATYREHCYPELAEELGAWLKEISSGPTVRGGVGARNEQHMAAKAQSRAKAATVSRSRPKVKMKVAERKVQKKKRKRSTRAPGR